MDKPIKTVEKIEEPNDLNCLNYVKSSKKTSIKDVDFQRSYFNFFDNY
jgi:hypothetical protein